MTLAERGLSDLTPFVKAFRLSYGELEASLNLEEIGVADDGDLKADHIDLIDLAGARSSRTGTALMVFIDELQYVAERELAVLITALHRAPQNDRPITLMPAGLPQLAGQIAKARSYAERLLLFTVSAREGRGRLPWVTTMGHQ